MNYLNFENIIMLCIKCWFVLEIKGFWWKTKKKKKNEKTFNTVVVNIKRAMKMFHKHT